MWVILVIAIVAAAYAYANAPKPEARPPSTLDDVDVPTAEEGKSIPVLFGTRVLKSPVIVWYGDFSTARIKSKGQKIGEQFYLGVQQVFCMGPVDYVSRIDVDNKTVLLGNLKAGPAVINAWNIFGGKMKGGGVAGTIDIEFGHKTQGRNAYLKKMLGNDIPAYRGVLQLVHRRFYFGNSNVLKPWSVRASRIHTKQGGLPQWYDEKSQIGGNGRTITEDTRMPATRVDGYDEARGQGYVQFVFQPSKYTNIIVIDKPKGLFYKSYTVWSDWASKPKPWLADFEIIAVYPDRSSVTSKYNFPQKETPEASEDYASIHLNYSDSGARQYIIRMYDWPMNDNRGGLSFRVREFSHVDMNPAHIIREALTEPWGLRIPDYDINDDVYRAAADQLYQEGFGLSFVNSGQGSAGDFIREVCKHINAAVYVDRFTGKHVLKLIRGDYDADNLPILDNTHVIAIKNFKKPSLSERTNSVTVNFYDAEIDSAGSVTVQHNALIDKMGGSTNNTTITYDGVTNRDLAIRLADRDLRSLSKSLINCQLEVTRAIHRLQIGDVFRLQLNEYGGINTVMRITKMTLGDSTNRSIIIDCTEDAFALPDTAIYDAIESQFDSGKKPPSPATDYTIRELSLHEFYREQGAISGKMILQAAPTYGQLGAASAKPEGATEALLMLDKNQDNDYRESDSFDFCQSATLVTQLAQGETTAQVENGTMLLNIELPALAQIGQELVQVIAFEEGTATLTLSRAAADTVPEKHPVGEKFLFIEDTLSIDDSEYLQGNTVDAKILTLSSLGQTELGDTPKTTVEFDARMLRPYPPGNVKVNGEYFPDQLNADLTLSWAHRDRTTENGQVITDFATGDVGPEAGTAYNVTVKDENGSLLEQSLQQIGTSFSYTNELELAAFDTEVKPKTGVFVLAGTESNAPPTRGLIALYQCESLTGGVLVDSSGSSKNGSIVSGAIVSGVVGSAIKFNGATSQGASTDHFKSISTGWAISLWISVTWRTDTYDCIFMQTVVSGNQLRLFNYNGAGQGLVLSFDGINLGLGGPPPSGLTHVVAQYNSTTGLLELYQNNVLIDSQAVTTGLSTPNVTALIGKAPSTQTYGSRSINGWVDQIRLFSNPLTVDEIELLYQEPSPLPAPSGELGKRLSNPLNIEIESERDALASFQKHKIELARYGYNYKYKDLYKAR